MMGPVNDFLVVYLDSIDERLLEYLDEDDEVHGPPDFPRKAAPVHPSWFSAIKRIDRCLSVVQVRAKDG
jgi:hypothetical protein